MGLIEYFMNYISLLDRLLIGRISIGHIAGEELRTLAHGENSTSPGQCKSSLPKYSNIFSSHGFFSNRIVIPTIINGGKPSAFADSATRA